MEIRQLGPRKYKLKRGQRITCSAGNLWITTCGKDILLTEGESYRTEKKASGIIITPIGTPEAVISIK